MPTYISHHHNILSWKDFVLNALRNSRWKWYLVCLLLDSLLTRFHFFQFPYLRYILQVAGIHTFVMSFLILPWKNQYMLPSWDFFSWLVYFYSDRLLILLSGHGLWSQSCHWWPSWHLWVYRMFVEILIFKKKIVRLCLMIVGLLMVIPGYAYLAIYTHTDVRFTASML